MIPVVGPQPSPTLDATWYGIPRELLKNTGEAGVEALMCQDLGDLPMAKRIEIARICNVSQGWQHKGMWKL